MGQSCCRPIDVRPAGTAYSPPGTRGRSMTWGKVKPWLPLAGLFPVVWMVLYVMFWLDRADCVEPMLACLGNAFGNWTGDLVMFRWIDTTLGAGLLAAAAALAVIWTAFYQRMTALGDAAERRVVELTMIMWMLKNLFERAGLEFAAKKPADAISTFQEVKALYPRMHEVNPALVALLQTVIMDMQRHHDSDPEDWGYSAARCILLSKFFHDPRRLFDKAGNYVPSPPKLNPNDLGLLEHTGYRIHDIDFAASMFTWDDAIDQAAPPGR